MTIRDISIKCGLSVATVSKALNNYSDVSEGTRELVKRTAREMGYFPNSLARALKTNRTYNLGVLFVDDNLSGLTHNYFAEVLDSFKVAAERRGYDITFINHNIGERKMTYLEHCQYRNIDGVCLACVDFYAPEVIELINSRIPLVTIDHLFHNRTCIMSENRGGIKELVEYVYRLGHRKIAYIHGLQSAVTETRVTSFCRTISDFGLELPDGYLPEAPYNDPQATYREVQKLINRKDRPTCILMPDDYAALGGIEAIGAAGLRIPEDISIAGYDGIKLTQLISPKLTTIRQNTQKLGSEAAEQLINLIEKPMTTLTEAIVVRGKLLQGQSVRAIVD